MRNKRKKKMNSKYTKDHLVASSMGGTGCEENIDWKKRTEHIGKHSYLGVKLFHRQLMQIIDENVPTLKPEAIQVMEELKLAIEILMRERLMYKEKVFSYGKYPKK